MHETHQKVARRRVLRRARQRRSIHYSETHPQSEGMGRINQPLDVLELLLHENGLRHPSHALWKRDIQIRIAAVQPALHSFLLHQPRISNGNVAPTHAPCLTHANMGGQEKKRGAHQTHDRQRMGGHRLNKEHSYEVSGVWFSLARICDCETRWHTVGRVQNRQGRIDQENKHDMPGANTERALLLTRFSAQSMSSNSIPSQPGNCQVV